ncbi:hypothetical protein Tco_0991060 [Tanacetum coccineum]|uniref:Uncharacterized protein n=1 Tax=Tanacetum coccineum TaxID=301880 RepID=A0ABQ5EY86_9ASTR
MEILSHLKDVEMMRMKTKNPPLDQTEGPREEDLEKKLSQLVHSKKEDSTSHMASVKEGLISFKSLLTLPARHGPLQPWISTLDWNEDPHESFNELMDTPLISAFVLNRLKVDTLTPELLVSPTFKLMKGSCKSLMELEYFLKEKVEAILKSAWTEKDQIDKLLERKKVNEELRNVRWWEIVRRRPTAATKEPYDFII